MCALPLGTYIYVRMNLHLSKSVVLSALKTPGPQFIVLIRSLKMCTSDRSYKSQEPHFKPPLFFFFFLDTEVSLTLYTTGLNPRLNFREV